MIRLLAVDMDGTCLDSRSRITDNTINALRKAAASGIIVVPATGRSMACLPHRLAAGTVRDVEDCVDSWRKKEEDIRKNRDLFRYVITSNGAQITDIRENRTIFQKMIEKKDALDLINACRNLGVGVTSHINHEYLLQGRLLVALGHLIYGKDAGGVRWVRDMRETVRCTPYGIEEIQFYFMSPSAKKKIRNILKHFPQLDSAYTGIYVEVFSSEASKGNALCALQEYLGITREETATIGDGENDLSMFRGAGLKIAMGNAVPLLKEKSDCITSSNDQDGVAKAVESFILKV